MITVATSAWYKFPQGIIFISLLHLLLALISCNSPENDYPTIAEHSPTVGLALFKAKQNSKGVIIIFGADWCPPCRALDKILDQIDVKNELQPLYEIVKIDIGHWDKNIDTAKKYGNPIRTGIPGLVLLNQNGRIRKIIETKELYDLIKGDPDVLTLYLQKT